jgi:ABC-type sugar transport system permease subunit
MTKGKFDTASAVYYVYAKGLSSGFEFGYASAAAILLFLIIGVFSIAQFALLRQRRVLW